MRVPTLEQLEEELEALRRDGAGPPCDSDAIQEYVAKLRMLAVYLNADLRAPVISET